MIRPPRIVLDAMGGDAGVLSVVQGASRITTSKSPFPIALVGSPGEIQAALSNM